MPKGVYNHRPHQLFQKGHICKEGWGFQKGHKSFLTKIDYRKLSKMMKGKNNWNWQGGRYKTPQGYILILKPRHPFCNIQGYIKEHRLVMEKYLGRYLRPEEIVHHINGKKDDNRIKNIILFKNKSTHTKFHHPIGSPFFNR